MCIRTYASGTYIQYASSLNHPSSDIYSAAEKERKKRKKKNNGKWRKKKKKETMPSRRIKKLGKEAWFTLPTYLTYITYLT